MYLVSSVLHFLIPYGKITFLLILPYVCKARTVQLLFNFLIAFLPFRILSHRISNIHIRIRLPIIFSKSHNFSFPILLSLPSSISAIPLAENFGNSDSFLNNRPAPCHFLFVFHLVAISKLHLRSHTISLIISTIFTSILRTDDKYLTVSPTAS